MQCFVSGNIPTIKNVHTTRGRIPYLYPQLYWATIKRSEFIRTFQRRCQLVRFIRKPYGFLRFARAYDSGVNWIFILGGQRWVDWRGGGGVIPSSGETKRTSSQWRVHNQNSNGGPPIHTIAHQARPPPIVTPLAYDAILTDIYDFIRFKLTIIPRFILEPLHVFENITWKIQNE